jgi:hypothetical protein
MTLVAGFPISGPDPALVVAGLALGIWIARLGWNHLVARRWQWTIADWLWLTLLFGLALTYLSLL